MSDTRPSVLFSVVISSFFLVPLFPSTFITSLLTMGVFRILFLEGGRNFCCPLGGVITWHRAVECLVSVSNCVTYMLPLMLSYKHDDIVVLCLLWPIGGRDPPPPPPHPPPPPATPPPPSSQSAICFDSPDPIPRSLSLGCVHSWSNLSLHSAHPPQHLKIMIFVLILSPWGSSKYRPSAPFLREVASHVKNCHFGDDYY